MLVKDLICVIFDYILAFMTNAAFHAGYLNDPSTTIQQEKLDPTLTDYIAVLAAEHPFTKDIKVDARRVVSGLADNWPKLPACSAQARALWRCIAGMVHSLPTISTVPDILIRVSVGRAPMLPAWLPEPNEPTVIATFDASDGIVRQCVLSGSASAVSSLGPLAIRSGLMVICQHVAPLNSRFVDNHPWVIDNGRSWAGMYEGEPILRWDERRAGDRAPITGTPSPNLYPPILNPNFLNPELYPPFEHVMARPSQPPAPKVTQNGKRSGLLGTALFSGAANAVYKAIEAYQRQKHVKEAIKDEAANHEAKPDAATARNGQILPGNTATAIPPAEWWTLGWPHERGSATRPLPEVLAANTAANDAFSEPCPSHQPELPDTSIGADDNPRHMDHHQFETAMHDATDGSVPAHHASYVSHEAPGIEAKRDGLRESVSPTDGFLRHPHNNHSPSYEGLSPRSDSDSVTTSHDLSPDHSEVYERATAAGPGATRDRSKDQPFEESRSGGESESGQPKTNPDRNDTYQLYVMAEEKATERLQDDEHNEDEKRAKQAEEDVAAHNHLKAPTLEPSV
jgi:hypothetical protein